MGRPKNKEHMIRVERFEREAGKADWRPMMVLTPETLEYLQDIGTFKIKLGPGDALLVCRSKNSKERFGRTEK